MGSDVELTIYDRQNKKINLIKIILDSARFDQGKLQINIKKNGDKSNNRKNKIIDLADFTIPAENFIFQTKI